MPLPKRCAQRLRFICHRANQRGWRPLSPKVRNVTLRTLVAEEFHASILAILRAARRFHTRAFVHLGDFQTAPTKLRSRGRLLRAKVRNVIALRTLWTHEHRHSKRSNKSYSGLTMLRQSRRAVLVQTSAKFFTSRPEGRPLGSKGVQCHCAAHLRENLRIMNGPKAPYGVASGRGGSFKVASP